MGKLTRRTGEESDARDISIGHFYLPSTLHVLLNWYALHSQYWEVQIINGKIATHKSYISFLNPCTWRMGEAKKFT